MEISETNVVDAIGGARSILSKERGYKVTPDYSMCEAVSRKALSILHNPKEYETLGFVLPNEDHVVIRSTDKKLIIDGQYRQLIPQQYRENLPEVLLLEIQDLDSMSSHLQSIGMSRAHADAYAQGVLK